MSAAYGDEISKKYDNLCIDTDLFFKCGCNILNENSLIDFLCPVSKVSVTSIIGQQTHFSLDNTLSVEFLESYLSSIRVSIAEFGNFAFFCDHESDKNGFIKKFNVKTESRTVGNLFKFFNKFNVEEFDLLKSFSIVGMYNYKSSKSFYPWNFSEFQYDSETYSLEVHNLIHKGSCLCELHFDPFQFGTKCFIPSTIEGVIKLWFIVVETNATNVRSISTRLNILPFKRVSKDGKIKIRTTIQTNCIIVSKMLEYIKSGQMIVVQQLPGQVLQLPAGLMHAVLTAFDTKVNPTTFSILLGRDVVEFSPSIVSAIDSDLTTISRDLEHLKMYSFFQDQNNFNKLRELCNLKLRASNETILKRSKRHVGQFKKKFVIHTRNTGYKRCAKYLRNRK
jgi:hypothetical protein